MVKKKSVKVETTKTSEKLIGSKKKKPKQLFCLKFKCAQSGGLVSVDNVGASFKCPVCKSPMKYEHPQMRLTTTSKIRHEVLKVVEVGNE